MGAPAPEEQAGDKEDGCQPLYQGQAGAREDKCSLSLARTHRKGNLQALAALCVGLPEGRGNLFSQEENGLVSTRLGTDLGTTQADLSTPPLLTEGDSMAGT